MLILRFYIWFFKSNHFNKEKVMCVPPIDSITRNKQTTIHENKKKFQVKYIWLETNLGGHGHHLFPDFRQYVDNTTHRFLEESHMILKMDESWQMRYDGAKKERYDRILILIKRAWLTFCIVKRKDIRRVSSLEDWAQPQEDKDVLFLTMFWWKWKA